MDEYIEGCGILRIASVDSPFSIPDIYDAAFGDVQQIKYFNSVNKLFSQIVDVYPENLVNLVECCVLHAITYDDVKIIEYFDRIKTYRVRQMILDLIHAKLFTVILPCNCINILKYSFGNLCEYPFYEEFVEHSVKILEKCSLEVLEFLCEKSFSGTMVTFINLVVNILEKNMYLLNDKKIISFINPHWLSNKFIDMICEDSVVLPENAAIISNKYCVATGPMDLGELIGVIEEMRIVSSRKA